MATFVMISIRPLYLIWNAINMPCMDLMMFLRIRCDPLLLVVGSLTGDAYV
jgi:hypothetical protein